MGHQNVTIKNLRIVDVDDDILLIAGSVPGPNYSLIKVYGKGELAEEVVDFAAEEERIAQEKMLEAEKEAKEAPKDDKKEEKSEIPEGEETKEAKVEASTQE